MIDKKVYNSWKLVDSFSPIFSEVAHFPKVTGCKKKKRSSKKKSRGLFSERLCHTTHAPLNWGHKDALICQRLKRKGCGTQSGTKLKQCQQTAIVGLINIQLLTDCSVLSAAQYMVLSGNMSHIFHCMIDCVKTWQRNCINSSWLLRNMKKLDKIIHLSLWLIGLSLIWIWIIGYWAFTMTYSVI